jgi:hypothetical protein
VSDSERMAAARAAAHVAFDAHVDARRAWEFATMARGLPGHTYAAMETAHRAEVAAFAVWHNASTQIRIVQEGEVTEEVETLKRTLPTEGSKS